MRIEEIELYAEDGKVVLVIVIKARFFPTGEPRNPGN